MRSWISTKKRSYLVAAFALLAAIAAIFIQTTASRAVQAPTNVTVATVAGPAGTFSIAQGKTLTVTPGTWTDSPTSTTYQWYRCTSQIAATSIDPTNCQIIDGETATTHLNSVSDVGFFMTVKETVTNAMGSASYYSAATSQVRQSNVIATAMGSNCLIQSGRVYCAGANGFYNINNVNIGLLGIGTIGTKQTTYQGPLTTADGTVLTDIVSVSSTLSETCVINLVGNVYCFGSNLQGMFTDSTSRGQRTYFTKMDMSAGVPITGAVSISTSGQWFCFSKADGTAYCQGYNGYANLGYGTVTSTPSSYPTQVKINANTNLTGVLTVSGGNYSVTNGSTCALASDGTTVGASLYCWGKNDTGWVGDGTTVQKNYATLVTINGSTSGVSSVATGSNHTCAVASGAAYCWGSAASGGLGNNSSSGNVLTPTAVLPTAGGVVFTSGVTQIAVDSAGAGQTCVLKNTGAVYCTGANLFGQLDQGNTTNLLKLTPTLDFTSGITSISMGQYQLCAFNSTASTFSCSGDTYIGIFGNGTTVSSATRATTITQVTGLIGVNSKAPSSTISSLKGNSNPGDTLTDGSAWSGFPQPTLTYQWYKCPSAVVTSTSIPAGCNQISGETSSTYTVQAGDIGSYVSLLVTATSDSNVVNRILSQPNPVGQLPSMTSSPTISLPVNSAGLMVGLTASVAEGTWSGANPTGATSFQWYRCGNSGSATTTMPADCAEIYGATAATYTTTQSESGYYIRAGQKYTSTAGTIVALSDTSAQVRAANAISSNNNNTCAIRYGKVYCWGPAGSNYNGDNVSLVKSINIAPTPVKQADGNYLTDVIQIATGGSQACAIKVNGTLWCWGQYSNGTAGLGTTSGTIAATQITTSSPTQSSYNNWLQVAISNTMETCAIDTDGAIWCSGIAGYGFAGDNFTTNMTVFKKTTNANLTSGVIQITGSPFNTQFCAVKNTGTVYCWGQNQYGNVGDGQTASVKTAIVPLNMESGVTNVQFAGGSTCAIKNGAIWCWGLNDTQQFGMDTAQTANMYYTPIQLPALSGAADPTRGVTSIALTQNGVTNSQLCFVNYLGAAACSGANTFGQQNRADILSNTTFQPTRWTSGVSAISITGDDSKGIVTCAVVNNGVYCAGAPAAPQAGRNGNLGQRGVGDINPYVVSAGPRVAVGLADGVGILDKAPYAIQLSTTQNYSDGQTVTSSASWEAYPTATATYQWYSCLFPGSAINEVPADCSAISGANNSSYSVVAGDSGSFLRLAITVTNTFGNAVSLTSTSQVGNAPTASTPTGSVTISTPRLTTGTLLTAPEMPTFSGTPTPSNSTQWYHCTSSSSAWVSTLPAGCYPADGGTGSTYTATHSDDGFYIMVGFTSTSSAGSLSFFSPTTTSRTQFVNKLAMSGDGGACLIRSGKVYCWGLQTAGGALGSATVVGTNGLVLGTLAGYITKAPTAPVAMANGLALTNVVSVTMGKAHTCAVTYSGALYCWGYNANGQLGDGTAVSRYTAAPVLSAAGTPLTGVTQVAASYLNTCAIVNGAAVCWGGTDIVSPAKSYATGAVTGLSTDVQQIAMGQNHACAIANAALRCWGGSSGALGVAGQAGTIYTPAASISATINGNTVTLANGVTNVALGNMSVCAILLGKVYCWGYGTAPGNLGVPFTDQVNFLPAPPTGDGTANFDSGVVQVVGEVPGGAGFNSLFCAIKTNQAAYCGAYANALGAGNATVSTMTQLATNLSSGVTEMAIAGNTTSCAFKGSSLLCAGRGVSYLFLNTTTTDVVLHTAIPISIANAGFTEQAPIAGTATISGYTAVGNVLTSTPSNYESSGAWQGSPTPTMDTQWYVCDSSGIATSSLPSDCSAISAATTSSLTVAADQLGKYLRTGITATNSFGAVTGYSAAYGPVGTPPTLSSAAGIGAGNSPVLNSTTTITGTAGSFDSGTTANQWYRCGTSDASTATSTPSGCVAIPSATSTTYALSRSDIGGYLRFASIASNASGQSFTFSPTSTQVVEGSMIATGLSVTCAVKLGRVYCWGRNSYYTLGTGDTSTVTQVISSNLATTPVKINASTILEDVVDIQAYGKTVCAVTTAGALYCWGQNWNGELGRGTAVNTYSAFAGTPSAASDGAVFTSGVMGVTVGSSNVCAWKTSGVAYCWGYNSAGQLGNGSTTTTTALSPVPVSTLTNVTKISLGNSHACAAAGGAVYCWGQNSSGAVSEATTSGTQLTPLARTILTSGVTDVSSSGAVSCALMNYSVYCFGTNTTGALGADGYLPLGYTFSVGAFPLTGPMSSGVTSLWGAHGAGNPTCANKGDGTFYCWGNDAYGELPGILIPTTFSGALMGPTLSTVSSVTTFAHTYNTGVPTACYVAAGITGCSGYGGDYQLGTGLAANIVGTSSAAPAVFKPSTFNSLLGADYVAPVISNTPTITGSTFSSGQTLTGNTPTGYGFPTPVLTQKWVGCSEAGTSSSATPIDCSDISGATGTSYTLQNSDAGSRIRLAFVATNSVATAYSYTATSATPVAAAKANQTITFSGSVKQLPAGDFALAGTATSGLALTYTSTTLSVCTVAGSTVTPLTLGTCTITASQAGDASYNAATSVSASFTIESVPVQTTAVAIVSAANYRFGTAVTATAGTWTGNATITYARAWYRCDTAPSISAGTGTAAALAPTDCVLIAGASALSYTPVAADVGKFLAYAETATNTTSTGTNNRTTFAVTATAVEKQTQTITFAALTGVTYGSTPVTLTATTDRSLTVTFASSDTSVCTISGTTLTIVGGGSCDVTASQSGNATTAAATDVVRTLTVAKRAQTITFTGSTKQISGGDFAVAGTTTSGLVITYTSTTASICTVAGSTVTPVALGTCTIAASQAGNNSYNAATTVNASFDIQSRPVQTSPVSIATAANYRFGVPIVATPGTWTGNPSVNLGYGWMRCDSAPTVVSDAAGNGGANLPAGCTFITGANTTTYTPVLADVGKYLAINEVASNSPAGGLQQRTTVVPVASVIEKQTQAITFGALTSVIYGDAAVTLTATSDRSKTITYTSSNTAVCTISGSTLTIVGGGSCDVTASQAGDGSTLAATSVTQTLTVDKKVQTVTLPDFTAGVYLGANKASGATASSGLTVTLTTNDSAICTISGLNVVQVAPGDCTVTAAQAGNGNFFAATSVSKTFTIAKASQTITLPNFTGGTYGDSAKASGATTTSGLTIALASADTSICTVSGLNVNIVAPGTCSITASQAGNANYLAATDVTKSFTVAKAAQTITFTGSAKQKPAGTFTLAATTNSGLAIGYASTTASVCTVAGAVVTPLTLGTCTITASQAGDSNWLAATSVTASFTIESVPVQSAAVSIASAANYRFGVGLTATAGTWTGTATITYARAWYRCDTAPAISAATGTAATLAPSDCVAISGATALTYTPVAADLTKFLAIAETATNTTTSGGTANRTTFVATTTAVEKQTQTITFAALTAKTYGNAAFNLTATTDRSLTVSFASSNTAVCTVSGVTVTIVGAGNCDITASQSGNATTLAAADVVRTLTVNKAAQTITFTGSPKQFGDGAFTVAATTTSSLAISYASTTASVCTISGTTVTPVTLGTCTITASQAGDTNWLAATSVNASFTIESVPVQSNSVAIPSAAHYRFGTAITATAGSWTGTAVSAATRTWYRCVTAPSINAATGSASALKPADCTLISGATALTYTPVLADIGTYLVTAEAVTNTTSAGSNARTTFVSTSGLVEKQTQTITFARPNDGTFGDTDQTLVASTDRALTVALSTSTSAVCSVTGATLHFLKSGSCEVLANQVGNSTTEAAPQVSWTVAIAKANQTVSLGTITNQTYVPARTVLAVTSATSGMSPTLTSDDTAVCTVSGVVVSLVKSGTCSITSSQDGDERYNAATSVTKTFQIAKANQTLTFTIDSYVSLGDAAALDLTGSVNTGLTIDYSVSDGTICKVQDGKLVGLIPGQCSITATQAGDDRYNSASVTRTLQVGNYATVVSMNPIGAALTNSTSTGFTITFDGAITGFTAADLSTIPAGACTIGEPVANGDPSIYDVALTNCVEGSVVLKVAADSISNGAPGPKLDAIGETAVVIDRTFKPAVSVTAQFTSPTNRASLVYNVTFAEEVDGFTGADVSFAGTGSADCVAVVTGSGSAYVVTVTGCTEGTVIARVNANSVNDLAGNAGPAAQASSTSATVDLIAPDAATVTGLPASYSRPSEFTANFTVDSANTYHCTLDGVALQGCDGSLVIAQNLMTLGNHTLDVWATDAAGNDSVHYSHAWTIANYARPSTPVFNVAGFERTSFNHLLVKWNAVTSQSTELPVSALRLEYSTDGTTWTTLPDLAADATSYDLTIQSGYLYSFRLKAIAGDFAANASDYSATATYSAFYKPAILAMSTSAALQKPASGTKITLSGEDFRDYSNTNVNSITGTMVTVTDAGGKAFVAQVMSVTPTRIVFVVPTTTKVGVATIKVSVGSATFLRTSETRNLNILTKKANQVINFTAPATARFASPDVEANASMDSYSVPVFTIEPGSIGICSVSPTGLIHALKRGACNYKISSPASDAFNAFVSSVYTTAIIGINIPITFELPQALVDTFTSGNKVKITPDTYALSASADVGIPNLSVKISSAPETTCFVDAENLLHIIGVGNCSVTALAENDYYRTEVPVTRVFEVLKNNQSLTFIPPGTTVGELSALEATDSPSGFQLLALLDSGLTPQYESVNSEICSVDATGIVIWSGNLVKNPAQKCQIKIYHDGDANFEAIVPQVVEFGGRHLPPLAPVGGWIREPDGALAVGRTGGLAASGGDGVAVVVVTGNKITITPFSKGMYIGPITATVTIPYYVPVKNVMTLKNQVCTVKWGVLKKMKPSDPTTFKVKKFDNKKFCSANKDAVAYFTSGHRLLPTIVVKRDRRWPTTYLNKMGSNGKGQKIYPAVKTWHLTIG